MWNYFFKSSDKGINCCSAAVMIESSCYPRQQLVPDLRFGSLKVEAEHRPIRIHDLKHNSFHCSESLI